MIPAHSCPITIGSFTTKSASLSVYTHTHIHGVKQGHIFIYIWLQGYK
ncbi:hypothetical protein F383_01300 [Gossypium arboreum]|uniref:Uncharacterized protein n=1 Tax=Gossypium arboreum TaxID=29729 RepID=A0A0B0PUN7_GOSAR|nr:hypothetical protein F383_01297 [Gossypium arboreum]KHG27124.1 hypothetical protein F383_01299 [Gossypium arboreum]KHG27125.1 hypothetical protein F383_01300 [Gossypium arboreum]